VGSYERNQNHNIKNEAGPFRLAFRKGTLRITNKFGLPAPLVRAVSNSKYNKGDADFSVTELIKPPRITALEAQHWEELEEDASDRLWALMGSAGHEVLRRSADGGIVEERVSIELGGLKISGQMDYVVADNAIIDYKFVSVWAIQDGAKPEWEQQLNCYRYMAKQYGVVVKELKIIAILRDWSKLEAKRDSSYPQSQVTVLPIRMWDDAVVEQWLKMRTIAHVAARNGILPNCMPDDVWEKPERYACMKKGNKRASRVLDTRLDAGTWIASQPKPSDFNIEVRPAERPRCESYCAVSEFCQQFKDWKAAHGRT